MTDFSGPERTVKSLRKSQCCEQCNTMIEKGAEAKYNFGVWEGYNYSTYTHAECRDAAHEYAEINDLWGEEYPWFQYMDDSEHKHHEWLRVNHPVVAMRLKIS